MTLGIRSILAAAAELFARDGFESVSVAAIARRARVSKANVFHHYATKDELYLAVMKEACAAHAAHAAHAEELYRMPGKSVDKVRELIDFEIRSKVENSRRTRLTMRETFDGSPGRVRTIARKVYSRNFTAVVKIFEQGRDRGEFDAAMDPAAAAMLISGAAFFYFNCREALPEFREVARIETAGEYAERIAALVLSGILRRKSAATPRLTRRPGR